MKQLEARQLACSRTSLLYTFTGFSGPCALLLLRRVLFSFLPEGPSHFLREDFSRFPLCPACSSRSSQSALLILSRVLFSFSTECHCGLQTPYDTFAILFVNISALRDWCRRDRHWRERCVMASRGQAGSR